MKLVSMSNRSEKLAIQEYDKVTKIKEARKSESFINHNDKDKIKSKLLNNDDRDSVTNANVASNDDDHGTSSVRLLRIRRAAPDLETYGFHLTRTKWDPYPWISAVDVGTPAAQCGLKAGDCLLEVNGHNIIGMRITEIAKLVKASKEAVTLRVWTSNRLAKCNPESICCAPMPRTLQRLSVIVQSILSIIECPVCLETITPPAMQCQNGHLLCVNCRIRAAEKCPVCRDYYTPRRALIAEKIYATITNAFDLCHNEDKLRQKLFGRIKIQQQQQHQLLRSNGFSDSGGRAMEEFQKSFNCRQRRIARLPTNKFLTKLLYKKAYSMENLTEATQEATRNACKLLAANSMGEDITIQQQQQLQQEQQNTNTKSHHNRNGNDEDASDKRVCCERVYSRNDGNNNCEDTMQSCSNQFHWRTNDRNHLTSIVGQQYQQYQQQGQDERQVQQQQQQQQCTESMTATRLTTSATTDKETWPKIPGITATKATTMPMIATNNVAQSNGISKHYSLSTNDLYVAPDMTITPPSLTPKPRPSTMRTTSTTIASTMMTATLADKKVLRVADAEGRAIVTTAKTAANVTNSIDNNKNRMAAFLLLDKRNSSIESLSSSIECIRRSSLLHEQPEQDTFDNDENEEAMKTMKIPSPAVDLEIIGPPSMADADADADAEMLNKTRENDLQQFSMTDKATEKIKVEDALPSSTKVTLSHSASTRSIIEDTSWPSSDTVECMSSTL